MIGWHGFGEYYLKDNLSAHMNEKTIDTAIQVNRYIAMLPSTINTVFTAFVIAPMNLELLE